MKNRLSGLFVVVGIYEEGALHRHLYLFQKGDCERLIHHIDNNSSHVPEIVRVSAKLAILQQCDECEGA